MAENNNEITNHLFPDTLYANLPEELLETTKIFEGRQKDVALLSGLSVLSACLPNLYGTYGGMKIYSNLYLMIIAPPASGKGVMNYYRGFVEPIHKKVVADSEAAYKTWKKKSEKEKKEETMPSFQTKIIPANISSAELYNKIKYAHYGGIMIESEADTLSNMLKQEWGNFSDVLRKAFHHEYISISRKQDNFNLEIEEPKLSLVLSGTPDQLGPVVQSKYNGLFSRFMYYIFEEVNGWIDVFKHQTDLRTNFQKYGADSIYKLYSDLAQRTSMLEFVLSKEQKQEFNSLMSMITDIVMKHHPKDFRSNVIRHGLIFYRICMILSALRNKDKIGVINRLECSDLDFEIAAELTKQLLYHALYVYKSQGDVEKELSSVDDLILKSLKEKFTRKEAVEEGLKNDLCERTMANRLKTWVKIKAIKKLKHGSYQKE